MARRETGVPKRAAHRPKVIINWDVVDKYLIAGCTGVQIAALIGMHPETLYDRTKLEKRTGFTEYSLSKKLKGDSLLLGKQYSLAMEGDKTMLIWLGKNRLGQRDMRHTEIEAKTEIVQKKLLELPDNGRREVECEYTVVND